MYSEVLLRDGMESAVNAERVNDLLSLNILVCVLPYYIMHLSASPLVPFTFS